ncbi:unnamed protein product [Cylicostephanus goldi]|uniref:Uncharacterized protein n=1 Tax=Cylicostephanus goldi TaxID=71465 RepID=A0A3P7Q1L2_CYLGO|nr:unnamed protein product [Cylicostephanus goldi]
MSLHFKSDFNGRKKPYLRHVRDCLSFQRNFHLTHYLNSVELNLTSGRNISCQKNAIKFCTCL